MIIGLLGKPSSGKSSFFKAATMIDVKISSVPFTTIEPNAGVGYVTIDCVCKELDVKCNPKHGFCKDGKRYIPVRLIDCGGLIPGSHLGKGIGNKFLDDIRQATVLIQVIDSSGQTDSEGKPTTGYDPETEIKFLEEEIDLWFASVISKALEKSRARNAAFTKYDLINLLVQQLSGLEVSKKIIEELAERISVTDTERFAKELRKLSKPMVYAANKIDLSDSQQNFERLKEKYKNMVPTSAEAEIALKKAAEKELINYLPDGNFEIIDTSKLESSQLKVLEFIKKNVVEKYGSTGIQTCLNKAVFEFLNYVAVYPVEDMNKLSDRYGNKLPDVHLMPKGSTALDLAFKIHTDIGNKFICAIDAKTKRKLSADYQLKNNDVVEIAFSK